MNTMSCIDGNMQVLFNHKIQFTRKVVKFYGISKHKMYIFSIEKSSKLNINYTKTLWSCEHRCKHSCIAAIIANIITFDRICGVKTTLQSSNSCTNNDVLCEWCIILETTYYCASQLGFVAIIVIHCSKQWISLTVL